mmetsp:Transcript_1197/g.2580  ORF Transcript_1197/g.2580 Transcript_1197/m.2580 type:complete len:299 (-) Transcript_1197:349-1245(-)
MDTPSFNPFPLTFLICNVKVIRFDLFTGPRHPHFGRCKKSPDWKSAFVRDASKMWIGLRCHTVIYNSLIQGTSKHTHTKQGSMHSFFPSLHYEDLLSPRDVVRHQVFDDVHHARQRSPARNDQVLEPVLHHVHPVDLPDPLYEGIDLVLLDLHVVVLIAPDHHLQQILEDVRPQILLHLPQNIPVLLHLLREGRHALPLRLRDHVQRLLHVLQAVHGVGQLAHRFVESDVFAREAVHVPSHGLVRLLQRDDVGQFRLLVVGVRPEDAGEHTGDEGQRAPAHYHSRDGRSHGGEGEESR